jgi:hypothetical protein
MKFQKMTLTLFCKRSGILTAIRSYLERSGAIVIDTDGYITWMRNEGLGQLTLGEVADMSSDLKKLLKKHIPNREDLT